MVERRKSRRIFAGATIEIYQSSLGRFQLDLRSVEADCGIKHVDEEIMSERSDKFSKELDVLIHEGDLLYIAIQRECLPNEFESEVLRKFDGDQDKYERYIKKLPDFCRDYQKWYSQSQAVIKQTLPDRLKDFISYYEFPRTRKEITTENYVIRDCLQGLQKKRHDGVIILGRYSAIPNFVQQLNILKSARDTLGSTLMDLKAVLQADLFDTEIDTAGVLGAAGYLRASGAICGVVIEKHLAYVLETHNIKVAKKNPGISDLAQLLRSSNVITLAQERFIQSLADTRNICSHAKGREPTKQEIDELLEGTSKVLKTVF